MKAIVFVLMVILALRDIPGLEKRERRVYILALAAAAGICLRWALR